MAVYTKNYPLGLSGISPIGLRKDASDIIKLESEYNEDTMQTKITASIDLERCTHIPDVLTGQY